MSEPEVYDEDGDFDENQALAVLLLDEKLIVNGFVRGDIVEREPVALYVICNDIFAWGMADLEPMTLADIKPLYDMHVADKAIGTYRWCCIHRGEKPQAPVEKWWRDAGVWDEVMESLSENKYDASWREYRRQKEMGNA